MKISFYAAPSIALLMLMLASSFVTGQTMQRSMVYRAQPSQSTAQTANRTQAATTNSTSVNKQVSDGKNDSANTESRVVKTSYVTSGKPARSASDVLPVVPRTTTALAKSTVITLQPAASHIATGHTADAKTAEAKPVAVPAHLRVKGREVSARKHFDKWFLASSTVFVVGAIMDHQSTSAGMKKAGAREANPLLRNSDGSFSPGKHLALTAGVYGVSLMLQRKHPKMANVLRMIGGAAKIGVSIHNRRVAQGR